MELIDKDALVAEIDNWRDKIIKSISDIPLIGRDRADATFEYEILGEVKDFLDFFEVKKVDLEKEITRVSKMSILILLTGSLLLVIFMNLVLKRIISYDNRRKSKTC